MDDTRVMLITGTRKGIGRWLVEHYAEQGLMVIGCSRGEKTFDHANYRHYTLDVADENQVRSMFSDIRKTDKRLDVLINNAGTASMNHSILTPSKTVRKILETNTLGTFLFCREAAKLMKKRGFGRIVNFGTVATPLKLEGEAAYAASKAAVLTLTQIFAREFAEMGITVNAVGPSPILTDLIRSVPEERIQAILQRQAIPRFGEFRDVLNVIEFFIQPESDFVTGQTIFLGGVS